jgi:hypothetical protein
MKYKGAVKALSRLDKIHEGCGGTLVACVGGFYWCNGCDFAGFLSSLPKSKVTL